MILPVIRAEIRPVADPARDAPRECIGEDAGVALLCLLEEPELVPPRAAEVVARVLVRRLRPVGALAVAANLDLQQVQ